MDLALYFTVVMVAALWGIVRAHLLSLALLLFLALVLSLVSLAPAGRVAEGITALAGQG